MKKNIMNLFLPFFLGGVVGLVISNLIDYESLILPPLAPPKVLFPIAWTIIYILMGLSFYLYRKNSITDEKTSFVYYLQLIINCLWSIIFFVLKWRFIAIIWIILLDVLVIYLIYLFNKSNKTSTYLNIPYLIWILFATYLTIAIYILN